MEFDDRAYLSATACGEKECVSGRRSGFLLSFRSRLFLSLAVLMVAMLAGIGKAEAVVHVDPSGPAGQQYALPLDAVRGQVGGNPSAGVPGASVEAAPLFGEGIRPTGSRNGENQGAGGNDDRSSRRFAEGAGKGSTTAEDEAVNRAIAELAGNPERESSMPLVIVLGGMLILGIGAGWLGRRAL